MSWPAGWGQGGFEDANRARRSSSRLKGAGSAVSAWSAAPKVPTYALLVEWAWPEPHRADVAADAAIAEHVAAEERWGSCDAHVPPAPPGDERARAEMPPPPPPAASPAEKRRVSFSDTLVSVHEYEVEEEEEVFLTYKATPKTRRVPPHPRTAGAARDRPARRYSALGLFKDEHLDALLASGLDKVGATKAAAKKFLELKKRDPAAADRYAQRAREMNAACDAA